MIEKIINSDEKSIFLNYEVVIIGGGPAGLAASIEVKKSGVEKALLLERDTRLGGILLQCIHNGFGLHYFGEELTGTEYSARFVSKVHELNIEFKIDTTVLSIEKLESSEILVTAINTKDGLIFIKTKALVLAMGCRERTRGALVIPGERPAGIFTAGAAQRFVNIEGYLPGKKIVILGSGDIGLIMARRLTLEGAEVKLICEIMPFSAGLARNIVQCVENFNIPVKFSHTITKIHGKQRLEGVTISEVDSNRKSIAGTESFVECDTLLLSVGLIPENELSINCAVAIDAATSGPVVNETMETSIEGIFACGNSVHVHDLVDFVTEESIRAGAMAASYVKLKERKKYLRIPIRSANRVRYTVPQYIDSLDHEKIVIMFRVTDVYRNVNVVVSTGTERIYSAKKRIVRPGEMQVIELDKMQIEKLKESVTVSVELPEEDID